MANEMNIMLIPGGKSGYATRRNGKRQIFRKGISRKVDAKFGQELLDTKYFKTVALNDGPNKAKKNRAASLVDRIAGMDERTMARFEALAIAAQTGPTMTVAPEPEAEAPPIPQKAAKRKTATKKKGAKRRTLKTAKG